MEFSPSTENDVEQLTEWIQADPYHKDCLNPHWWLTGTEGSLLAFCLTDGKGPLTYVRLDSEYGYVRIHTQFAPESVVSKRRLVVGMIGAINKLKEYYQDHKGLVFKSVSPNLIDFMGRLGFVSVGNNDYRFNFEGQL